MIIGAKSGLVVDYPGDRVQVPGDLLGVPAAATVAAHVGCNIIETGSDSYRLAQTRARAEHNTRQPESAVSR